MDAETMTDNGPKKTRQNVATASANHALPLTIKFSLDNYNIKYAL
jgi:hypothetical protein